MSAMSTRPHPSLRATFPLEGEGCFRQFIIIRFSADFTVSQEAEHKRFCTAEGSLPPGGEGGTPVPDEGETGERTHARHPPRAFPRVRKVARQCRMRAKSASGTTSCNRPAAAAFPFEGEGGEKRRMRAKQHRCHKKNGYFRTILVIFPFPPDSALPLWRLMLAMTYCGMKAGLPSPVLATIST